MFKNYNNIIYFLYTINSSKKEVKMHFKNEKKLLLLIKYVLPFLILFLSIIITAFLYLDNKSQFEKIQNNIEAKFIKDKKLIIKEQIDNLYGYIISEQKHTIENLKKTLISRVHEAHTIATNIHDKFKDKHSKEEITHMIKSALKDIRFNNQRGYFFIYDKKATNVMHPLVPSLEGKNLINYQDTKGVYVLRESLDFLKDNDESYQEWHWRKIKGNPKEFKKIGFVKNIYALDWFLGTGEYVEDFSKDMQKKVIEQIEKFRFGENGYFIITDKNNNYISHINKTLIGENALKALRSMNNFDAIKNIQKVIDEKKGFVYLDFFKPDSSKISSKIIYLKTIPKWNWVISTGFYKDDIQKIIDKEKDELVNKYNANIKNVLILASLATFILLLLSIYISNIIEKKFKKYKDDINHHINENQQQYDLLAQKSKLAAMGEMIGNIAHQWRQPLSVITTAATGIKVHREMGTLNDTLLDKSIDGIATSAQHLSETIDDFRDFFKPDREITKFKLENAIDRTFNLLDSQFTVKSISIIKNMEEITISGFERELLQVFLNIVNNAKDALEMVEKEKFIFIDIYKEKNNVIIKIKDNAGGMKKDIIKRVFEPYFTTKHKSQGTGIGLYMSQEIVTRHMHGRITVDNESFTYLGNTYKGACFKICLPLYLNT